MEKSSPFSDIEDAARAKPVVQGNATRAMNKARGKVMALSPDSVLANILEAKSFVDAAEVKVIQFNQVVTSFCVLSGLSASKVEEDVHIGVVFSYEDEICSWKAEIESLKTNITSNNVTAIEHPRMHALRAPNHRRGPPFPTSCGVSELCEDDSIHAFISWKNQWDHYYETQYIADASRSSQIHLLLQALGSGITRLLR